MCLKYTGIQYIGNYNLNRAMGAYYNTLGIYYNMGAYFLVTLKNGRLLEQRDLAYIKKYSFLRFQPVSPTSTSRISAVDLSADNLSLLKSA